VFRHYFPCNRITPDCDLRRLGGDRSLLQALHVVHALEASLSFVDLFEIEISQIHVAVGQYVYG